MTFKALTLITFCLLASPLSLANNTSPIKILFLGDSLTAGYGVEKKSSYPSLIETHLVNKGISVQAINSGVSGSTSASASRRLKWQLKAKPQVLVLALGANDGLRGLPLNSTKKNLEEAIQIAIQANITILLTGMKVPPNYGKKYSDDFDALYLDLTKKYKIKFMPFLLKDVAGQPQLNLSDGIHPNEQGHEKIRDNLLPYLEPLLK